MKKKEIKMQKASFTIEGAIYIPFVMFLMTQVLQIGIHCYQESILRESMEQLQEPNIVEHFYKYQLLKEMGEMWNDDTSAD